MSVAAPPLFAFDNSFVRELPGLYVPWHGRLAPAPRLLALNEGLAAEVGADPEALRSEEGIAVLSGSVAPAGAEPVAQAYAGHQFGGWAPRLGDGRALLLGEVVDVHGRRRDLHLKGSGRTPFARGADGKAAVGPMLREWVVGEAMHALGIPTTRALAVVATGEQVLREVPLPGAVLVRVAASHLRVGTFQYAAAQRDRELLRRLADHAIARHHPAAAAAERPYLALFEHVVEAQAALVAKWMLVGFVHGVMNTDNMTISGETIDYGPCAFLDAYDPATAFSSIDVQGRYAYGNQPPVAQWDLARLAEALLPLIDEDAQAAVAPVTEVLGTFPDRYRGHWLAGMRAKLGLAGAREEDAALAEDLLAALQHARADFTASFRALGAAVRGDEAPVRAGFADAAALGAWTERWRARLAAEGRDPEAVAAGLDRANPLYIPRNHLVEAALADATGGDLEPVRRLVEAVSRPFDERPGLEAYAESAPAGCAPYVTYCGT
jgi:protein adenylyltransferase